MHYVCSMYSKGKAGTVPKGKNTSQRKLVVTFMKKNDARVHNFYCYIFIKKYVSYSVISATFSASALILLL